MRGIVKVFLVCSSRLWMALTLMGFGIADCSRADEANDVDHLRAQVIKLRDESKWPEAIPIAQELVTLVEHKLGTHSVEMAEALHLWAWLVQQNGDYAKAEQLWLRALDIDEYMFGKDAIQTTRRLHLLANLYRERRDFQKAAPLIQRAL